MFPHLPSNSLSPSGDQRVDSLRSFVFLIPISSPRLSLSRPRNGNKNRHVYRKAQKHLPGPSLPWRIIRGGFISRKPLQPGTSRHAASWLFTNNSPNIYCGNMWPSGGACPQTGDELRTWISPHLLLSPRRVGTVVQLLTTQLF